VRKELCWINSIVMKLRLDKNSLRLRVKKSDLETLCEKSTISESIGFPGGSFNYSLSISDIETEVMANMKGSSLEVMIPSHTASVWINSDETGIYHSIHFDNEHSLNITIEKDFPCKERPEEDTSDTFVELAEKNKDGHC